MSHRKFGERFRRFWQRRKKKGFPILTGIRDVIEIILGR